MRVLVISHNAISEMNNMGKTLLSYFRAFEPEEVAEFYIQDKEPQNAEVSKKYFRITDQDALKSVFGKRVGNSYELNTSKKEESSKSLTGAIEVIRKYGRKRDVLLYIFRNSVWALSHWKTKEFISWLKEFDPDVIFFMAGDYSFLYNITFEIQKMLKKPLVVCCVDDYYLYNKNEKSFLGRVQHKSYMKSVHKVMEKASLILTISDSMGQAYHELFQRETHTLHTGARKNSQEAAGKGSKVAYFGNLGFRRYEQIVEIGKAIKSLGLEKIDGIDLYSGEKRDDVIRCLTMENGVNFHGEIPASEIPGKMQECAAIVHTESFDPNIQKTIRYSVSTKIADSLLNGPCLIAYGPEGIASIDYLKKNNAAYVISKPEDLKSGLKEILENEKLREQIVKNARILAEKNHDADVNSKKVRKWLEEVVQENK